MTVLRPHPFVLMPPIVMLILALIVAGILTNVWGQQDRGRLLFIWAVFGLVLLRFVWKALEWYVTYFAMASNRVLLYSGLIRRRLTVRSLTKVIGIDLHRSIGGRLFGYGEIRVTSMSQEAPFWIFHYSPYPVQVFLDMYGRTFPGYPIPAQALSRLSKWEQKYIETPTEPGVPS
jgi:hypothetical protein